MAANLPLYHREERASRIRVVSFPKSTKPYPELGHTANQRATQRERHVVAPEGTVLPNVLTLSALKPQQQMTNPPKRDCSAIILVVDDEEPLRAFLALLFEDLGHKVVTAMNGRQALDAARTEHPDLVVADVMMPEMGGVEMTLRLRAGEAGDPAVRVILMSAAGRVAARKAAADAFIDKPFDLDAMVDLVERYLGPSPTST